MSSHTNNFNDTGFYRPSKLDFAALADGMLINTSGVVSTAPLGYSSTEQLAGYEYNGYDVYFRTFTGTITASANARASTPIIASGVKAMLAVDGWWTFTAGYIANIGGADSLGRYSGGMFSSLAGSVNLVTTSEAPRTNAAYMVRVFYTKS